MVRYVNHLPPYPTAEYRQRRLRAVRRMLETGCDVPDVQERFGVCEETARELMRQARAAAEQGAR